MAKHKLTATQIRSAKPGMHSDGAGVYLQVTKTARSWIYRFTSPVTGKRREMGLGPISPPQARALADEARAQVLDGQDPLAKRHRVEVGGTSFGELMLKVVALKEQSLSNHKAAMQWRSTLAEYAKPLHDLSISEITPQDVVACLEPIWQTKAETARRVAQRIRAVLDHAEALGIATTNPASVNKLKVLLPAQGGTVKHHPAVALGEAQGAFRKIWERRSSGQGVRALCYAILAAARSGEARRLEWSWIEGDTVMMPVGSMKRKGVPHRVPISGLMRELLNEAPRFSWSPLTFPSSQGGQVSDATLGAVHKRLGIDAVPHGWRSTFREWCLREGVQDNLAESALHHQFRTAVQSAYARSDLLDQRRDVMERWAKWLMM